MAPQLAPTTTVITAAELDRMRGSTVTPPITDFEARRRSLKQLSDSRVKNWKNTLQAMREKKLQWKAEKLAQQEKERQVIDKEEAEVRHQQRLEALRRANALLNEQTDLMKGFRSAQLYSEVLASRNKQLKDTGKADRMEKERDMVYYGMMMEQIAEYDAKEEAAAKKRKDTEKKIAHNQREQLDEAQHRREVEKEAARVEGEAILKKAMAEVEEDRKKAHDRMMWHRRNNEEMTLANVRLQELRGELAKKDAEEDAKIEGVVKQKEMTAKARRKFEQDRFEAKQAMRKRMIDRALEELSRFTNNENSRMLKQAQEMRDKEDAEMNRRADIRRRQREAIEYSRELQMRLKEERKKADTAANKLQAEVWGKRNEELDREEREAEELRFRKNIEIKHFHEMQMKIAEKRREEERLSRKLGEAQGSAIRMEDRDRFTDYAIKEVEKAREAGKPIYPLLKAIRYKAEPLMACKVNRRARRDAQPKAPEA